MKSHVKSETSETVIRHRRRLSQRALRRVEMVVPAEDVQRLRGVAAALRAGGAKGNAIRHALDANLDCSAAATGASLFHFVGDPLSENFELELPDRKLSDYEPVDFSEI